MTHELGHTLGLFHSDNANDIMFDPAQRPASVTFRTMSDYDRAGAVHQHPDQDMSGTLPFETVLRGDYVGTASSSYFSTFSPLQNLTIPAGGSLELEPGAHFGFAAGRKLTVEGTLDASGITFTDAGSGWGGIVFKTGSAGTIESGSKVENVDTGSTNGDHSIRIEGGVVQFRDSDLISAPTNWAWAIEATGGSLTVTDSRIKSTTGHGIVSQGTSSVSARDTHFEVWNPGAFGGLVSNWGALVSGYDNDFTGVGQALRASGSIGVIAAGSAATPGGNNFCGDTLSNPPDPSTPTILVEATSGATISAENNYWPSGGPAGRTAGAGVDSVPYEVGSPTCGAAMKGVNPATGAVAAHETGKSGDVHRGITLLLEGNHAEAERIFLETLAGDPDDSAVRMALNGLVRTYMKTGNPRAVSSVKLLGQTNPAYRLVSLRTLVTMYGETDQAGRALGQLEVLSNTGAGSAELFAARLSLVHAWKDTPDRARALGLLASLQPNNEEQARAVASAYRSMELYADGAAPKVNTLSGRNSSAEIPPNHVTASAYPNPFNPVTILSVQVREPGLTTVTVYDILGRRVESLVDGYLESGVHDFRFDAFNLPSGVYLYQVVSDGQRVGGTLSLVR